MIVNVIHRPASGRLYEMFRLQQKFAHDLGLKVTLLIPYDFFFKPDVMADIMADHNTYGDELGIWMGELTGGKMQETVPCKEPFLWLHTRQSKEKILKTIHSLRPCHREPQHLRGRESEEIGDAWELMIKTGDRAESKDNKPTAGCPELQIPDVSAFGPCFGLIVGWIAALKSQEPF